MSGITRRLAVRILSLGLPPEERLATVGPSRGSNGGLPGGGDALNLRVHQGSAARHGPFGIKNKDKARLVKEGIFISLSLSNGQW
jgi:hypothetical protein